LGTACGKEKFMMANPLIKISARLIIVWLCVSVFFFMFGEWIIEVLLPFLTFVTNLLAENYGAELNIASSDAGKIIEIVATATEDVYRLEVPIAPKGTSITGKATLMHALVPLVILFTILLSWSVEIKKFLIQVVLGFPVALMILGLTTPMLLNSYIENVFHSAAENYSGKELPLPLMMDWVVVMEMGGVWLLPIIGAFFCIQASAAFVRFFTRDSAI
jgi:hypothetical protein